MVIGDVDAQQGLPVLDLLRAQLFLNSRRRDRSCCVVRRPSPTADAAATVATADCNWSHRINFFIKYTFADILMGTTTTTTSSNSSSSCSGSGGGRVARWVGSGNDSSGVQVSIDDGVAAAAAAAAEEGVRALHLVVRAVPVAAETRRCSIASVL